MTPKSHSRQQHAPIWPALAIIIALPFSYHPLVSFGTLAGMHLDGSLLYGIVIAALITSLPLVWRQKTVLLHSHVFLVLAAFWICNMLSVPWSDNPIRGVVTSLFLLLLIGVVGMFALYTPSLKQHQRQVYRVASAGVCISIAWALWQIFADTIGVDRIFTLLPIAYESAVFGIARPTGFALEPQFFASLLLIPFFWLIWRFLVDKRLNLLYLGGVLAVGSVVLLTLSRGAIYAAVLGLILMLLFQCTPLRRWLAIAGTLLLTLVLGGVIIFTAASVNQRDSISGSDSLAKTVNHLTLGAVSLPPVSPSSTPPENAPRKPNLPKTSSGYVTASTDSRLNMSAQAVSLWMTNPYTFLFGVGSGSFGATLHDKNERYPADSIVNNYYLEILVETGLVGLGLFLGFLGYLLYRLFQVRQTLTVVILFSLLVQALFFSGNANVIHLWAVIGVALGLALHSAKKASRLVQLS